MAQHLSAPPDAIDEEQAKALTQQTSPKALLQSSSNRLIENLTSIFDQPVVRRREQVARYIRMYPVRSASSAAVVIAALAAVVLLTGTPSDRNPTHALIQNHTLIVYNRDNKILWTKNVEGHPDYPRITSASGRKYWPYEARYYQKLDDAIDPLPVRVFDIDGDGNNEVLFSSGATENYTMALSPDSLYCFNGDGTLRWRYAPERKGIRFGSADFSAENNWRIIRFIRVQRTPGERVQLFAASIHLPSWPTRIAELDTRNGDELHTYWHTGGLTMAVVTDIEGDGSQEIVFAGINNAYDRVCIIVFDPSNVRGAGPTKKEWKALDRLSGTEKYYVLLPKVEGIPSNVPYNMARQLEAPNDGGLMFQTSEGTFEAWRELSDFGGIVYTLGRRMEVTSVIASSRFEMSLERAKREGFLSELRLGENFYRHLKSSVHYWDRTRNEFVDYDKFVASHPGIARNSSKKSSPLSSSR